MQTPTSVRDKKTLDKIFKHLDEAKKASEISFYLNGLGLYNLILNRKQLQKIYFFENTRSRLIKETLAIALFKLQTKKAIDITIKLTNDKYKNVRYWAVFNLVEHVISNNKKIRNALWDRVHKDTDKRIKELAVVGLVKRKNNNVIEIAKKQFLKNMDVHLMDAFWNFNNLAIFYFLRENIKNIPTDNQDWIKKTERHLDDLIKELVDSK